MSDINSSVDVFFQFSPDGGRGGWNLFGSRRRAAQQMRLSARNSGLFYLRATKEALAMMIALKRRMETEGVWDQV